MTDELNNAVERLLVNDALEATNDRAARATMLLVDAALSLLVSRHRGAAATELATMISGHILSVVAKVADHRPAPEDSADANVGQSDRLRTLLDGGTPFNGEGGLSPVGERSGTREEWESTAHVYCMATLYGTQGGTKGGIVPVSAAGLGLLLGLAERWAVAAGVIDAPGETA